MYPVSIYNNKLTMGKRSGGKKGRCTVLAGKEE
jgi:hypothetical protein